MASISILMSTISRASMVVRAGGSFYFPLGPDFLSPDAETLLSEEST